MMEPIGSPNEISFPFDQVNHNGKRIKILLLEDVSKVAVQNLKNEGYEVETLKGSPPHEELLEKIKDFHVLGIRSRTRVTEDILKAAKKLLCIGCFCIGTDKVDLDAACKLGIPVFNSPYQNSRSVAELIIAMIINLSRKVGDHNIKMHSGEWEKTSTNCHEIRGKTLGIVGYGHIGTQVSVLAEVLGMKVIYYDIVNQMPLGNSKPVSDLQTLLAKADFVTLHVPQTPETYNMIGKEQIQMMKKGSYLLNASRGNVVVIKDLIEALKSGHLSGAYLDVFPEEPSHNTKNCDLFVELSTCPNTILTPHIGGSTVEAQDAIGEEVSQRFIKFIKTGNTHGAVNFPEMDLPYTKRSVHRIINVHKNRRGILKELNNILSIYNVEGQNLRTNNEIGYFIADVDSNTSDEIKKRIQNMEDSIKTRIVY